MHRINKMGFTCDKIDKIAIEQKSIILTILDNNISQTMLDKNKRKS